MSSPSTTLNNGQPTKVRHHVAIMGFLASLVNYADRILISVAAPLILAELHLSPMEWGLILSAFFWTYSPCAFLGGILNDKLGAKTTYSLSMAVWSGFVAVTGLCWNFITFMIARLLFGVGEGPQPATTTKLVSNWFPKSDASKALSFAMLGVTVGPMLATPFVVWLMQMFGWRACFFILGAIGIVWVVAWHYTVTEKPQDHPKVNQAELAYIQSGQTEPTSETKSSAQTQGSKKGIWKLVCTPYILGICVCYFAYSWILFLVLTWYPSYLTQQHGVSFSAMGILASLPWVGATIGLMGGAIVADHFTKKARNGDQVSARKWIIAGSMFLTAVTFASSAYVADVYFSTFLITVAMLFLLASWQYQALIIAVVPQHQVGSMAGFIQFISTLAGILAPAATGYFIQYMDSFNAAFYIGAGLGIVGSLMVALFVKREGLRA